MYVYRGFALEEGKKSSIPLHKFPFSKSTVPFNILCGKGKRKQKKKRSLAAKQKLKAVPCQLVISLSAGVWRCAFTELVLK